jgi:hypothetical protein
LKLDDIIDGYDLKARVAPTAITFLPILFTSYYCFPALYNSPFLAAGSGLISMALIYLCSMIVRFLGIREQDRLWRLWGGPPSTRFARYRDGRFNAEQKNRIRTALTRIFELDLLGAEEEFKNPKTTDEKIEKAFLEVKEYLRQHEQSGLVDKHNVEYGFVRNLYGGRFILCAGIVLGLFVSGCALTNGKAWHFNTAVALNLICALTLLPVTFFLIPEMLKRNAEIYAERAWLTFLEIAEHERNVVPSVAPGKT